VERWIRDVKRRYLDAAPMKIVGLDYEFTDAAAGMQRATVVQLSVATDTLAFHICHADRVLEALRDFLMDTSIKLCGAAIHNDQLCCGLTEFIFRLSSTSIRSFNLTHIAIIF
jgi:hypothetical protein